MKKPFFRKQTQAWYVWQETGTGQKQVRLSRDKDEAFRLWHEMQVGSEPATPDTTVGEIIVQFLEWCKRHRSAGTFDWYRHYLTSFVNRLGHRKVTDIRAAHVEDWLESCFGHRTDTARNGAVRAVVRPFNHAVKRGLLDRNPIRAVERPQPQPRETYITADQWQKLMSCVDDESLRDILTVMRESGCRPHEVRTVEAEFVDRTMRAWVFPVNRSKGKRHRRVVPLTDTAWQVTQRLLVKTPEGPIFRTERGEPWSKQTLCRAMQRLSKRAGVECTAYSVRHTFCTDALANGVDPVTLSQIMGHRSLNMIQRVYAHVSLRQDHMRKSLERAVGRDAERDAG